MSVGKGETPYTISVQLVPTDFNRALSSIKDSVNAMATTISSMNKSISKIGLDMRKVVNDMDKITQKAEKWSSSIKEGVGKTGSRIEVQAGGRTTSKEREVFRSVEAIKKSMDDVVKVVAAQSRQVISKLESQERPPLGLTSKEIERYRGLKKSMVPDWTGSMTSGDPNKVMSLPPQVMKFIDDIDTKYNRTAFGESFGSGRDTLNDLNFIRRSSELTQREIYLKSKQDAKYYDAILMDQKKLRAEDSKRLYESMLERLGSVVEETTRSKEFLKKISDEFRGIFGGGEKRNDALPDSGLGGLMPKRTETSMMFEKEESAGGGSRSGGGGRKSQQKGQYSPFATAMSDILFLRGVFRRDVFDMVLAGFLRAFKRGGFGLGGQGGGEEPPDKSSGQSSSSPMGVDFRSLTKHFEKLLPQLAFMGSMLFISVQIGQEMLKKLSESSPVLKAMLDLFNTMMMLVWMPLGNFIGFILKPILFLLLNKFVLPWFREWSQVARVGQKIGEEIAKLIEGFFSLDFTKAETWLGKILAILLVLAAFFLGRKFYDSLGRMFGFGGNNRPPPTTPGGAVGGCMEFCNRSVSKITSPITDTLSRIGSTISSGLGNLWTSVKDLLPTIIAIGGGIGIGTTLLSEIFSKQAEATSVGAETVNNISESNGILHAMRGDISDVENSLDNLASEVQAFKIDTNSSISVLDQTVKDIISKLDLVSSNIKTEISTSATSITTGVSNSISTLNTDISVNIKELVSSFTSSLEKFYNDIVVSINTFTGEVKTSGDYVAAVITLASDSIVGVISSLHIEIVNGFQDIVDAINTLDKIINGEQGGGGTSGGAGAGDTQDDFVYNKDRRRTTVVRRNRFLEEWLRDVNERLEENPYPLSEYFSGQSGSNSSVKPGMRPGVAPRAPIISRSTIVGGANSSGALDFMAKSSSGSKGGALDFMVSSINNLKSNSEDVKRSSKDLSRYWQNILDEAGYTEEVIAASARKVKDTSDVFKSDMRTGVDRFRSAWHDVIEEMKRLGKVRSKGSKSLDSSSSSSLSSYFESNSGKSPYHLKKRVDIARTSAYLKGMTPDEGEQEYLNSVKNYAMGGIINEHIVGVGQRSGDIYNIGERGREMVVPLNGSTGGSMNITVPITYYGSGMTKQEIEALKVEITKKIKDIMDSHTRS